MALKTHQKIMIGSFSSLIIIFMIFTGIMMYILFVKQEINYDSLDKKIKTKVKAPEAIQKYLFSASLKSGIVPFWYLRDMNFSPDFKESMAMVKKYYDKVPGEPEVEGIIAIDTKVLKDLLQQIQKENIGGRF